MSSEAYHLQLQVKGLAAERGGRVVAAGVNFALAPGDALTLRGANGTGKTSILRAVAGFSDISDGEISFEKRGEQLDPHEVRALRTHWLGGDDALADRLTVHESLTFWCELLGGASPPDLLTRLRLIGKENVPVGKLSTGQRRRVGIGRLLTASRPLWLLDEPMSGLDEDGKSQLLSIIADHRAQGGLVLMASHDEGIPGSPVLRLSSGEAA